MFRKTLVKVGRVVKKLFQNLILCKSLDSKTVLLSSFSSQCHAFWETTVLQKGCCYVFKFRRYMENQFKTWQEVNVFFWFKIWLILQKFIQNLTLFKSLGRKTFSPFFFNNCWFLRKRITAKFGVFTGWNEPRVVSWK